MGLYADKKLLEWFASKYTQVCGKKPDMGKSCIRFKNPGDMPFDLIGELAGKMSVDQWLHIYETEIAVSKSNQSKKQKSDKSSKGR